MYTYTNRWRGLLMSCDKKAKKKQKSKNVLEYRFWRGYNKMYMYVHVRSCTFYCLPVIGMFPVRQAGTECAACSTGSTLQHLWRHLQICGVTAWRSEQRCWKLTRRSNVLLVASWYFHDVIWLRNSGIMTLAAWVYIPLTPDLSEISMLLPIILRILIEN